MKFFTAVSLSLNNLMTKKGRTFLLTAFAGSIGINRHSTYFVTFKWNARIYKQA